MSPQPAVVVRLAIDRANDVVFAEEAGKEGNAA